MTRSTRIPRTGVGKRLDSVSVVQADEAGRAELVALDGERSPLVRGEEFRSVLTRRFGANSIRSPRFVVRKEARSLSFAGRGRGHGAGLCQRGAIARLRSGATVEQVLATYYPGTVLVTVLTPAVTSVTAAGAPSMPSRVRRRECTGSMASG